MGDPVLRQAASDILDPAAPEIVSLIETMRLSLAEARGIGLAAPQIGVSKRVIVFRVPDHRATEDPDDGPCPLTALINPTIEPVGHETVLDWEGCLSIPGMRG